MIQALDCAWTFITTVFSSIWVLYTGGSVLGFALVLWILDHFFDIFDILRR